MMIFLLKLTVAWGFFAMLYALVLRHETFFRANRAYLLSTSVWGIVLSLPIAWLPEWQGTAAVSAWSLPAVTVGLQQLEVQTRPGQWTDLLAIVYVAGVILTLLRILWGIWKIVQMAGSGVAERLPDGCVMIKTAETKVPFSFFQWLFVPLEPASESPLYNDAMLAHERAHARDWHSVDVLFVELLCVVFWFHPLAHWYRRSIRTVHEYLADAEASRQIDRKQYGLLLIRQAQSGVSLAFVNHFFQSPLKQRLIMLTRNASPALRAWKYGLFLPVFLFLFLVACQKSSQEQSGILPAPEPEPVVKGEAGAGAKQLYEVEQMPRFPGGQQALFKFMAENIEYPAAAKSESAEGLAVVTFVVGENGAITDVEGIVAETPGWRQDFQDEAVRVVKSMPYWEPALSKGKPVKVKFTLPVRFKLQ